MKCELSKVGLLAAGNLMLASTGNLLDKISQFAHLILVTGQVGVATITIIYIYRKARALRKPKSK